MNARETEDVEERIGDLLRRMLGTPLEPEALEVTRALRRMLVTCGRDFHEIADAVEHGGNGKLSESEMRLIFDNGFNTGFDAGLKEGESRSVQTFHNTSDDFSMAQYVWERIERLPQRHRDFVEGMVELAGEGELSVKQHAYLKSLYRRVGGK